MNTTLKKPEDSSANAPLLARPQRLGVLPTLSFWHDRDNWALVRVPVAVGMGALVFVLLSFAGGLPWYVGALIPALALTLALGLLERYIRARALQRRRLPPGE